MNDFETPPLPQPSGQTCPNCGAAQSANAKRCSNCGALLTRVAPSVASSIAKVLFSVFLALAALGLGAFAACLPMMEAIGSGSPNHTTSSETYSVMGVALLIAAGCVWGIFLINRKS